MALPLMEDWDVQYRMVYGYIGEIKFLPPDEERGAETPALLQIVAHLPFRYGKTRAATYDIWAHCRISACVSTDAFDSPVQLSRVCDPVSGFVESANSKDHFGAQLTGWDKVLASEWEVLHDASFPASIELIIDVISTMPQLANGNFSITHAPDVKYGRFVSPEVPKYYAFDERPTASAPSTVEPACNRPRGQANDPANSDERRLHIRWVGIRTFGRWPTRRGRPATKVVCLTIPTLFTSDMGKSKRKWTPS